MAARKLSPRGGANVIDTEEPLTKKIRIYDETSVELKEREKQRGLSGARIHIPNNAPGSKVNVTGKILYI